MPKKIVNPVFNFDGYIDPIEYIFGFDGHVDQGELVITNAEYTRPEDPYIESLLQDRDYLDRCTEDIIEHRKFFNALIRAVNYAEALDILKLHVPIPITLKAKPLYNLKQPYEDPNERDF